MPPCSAPARIFTAAVGLAWLAACSGAPPAPPTPALTATPRPLSMSLAEIEAEYAALPLGEVEAGRKAFTSAGCAACHSLEPEKRIVGPTLAGIGARAPEREPGLSAELYLYKSLTRPDAYVVESFTPGLMPQTFYDTLAPQTQADLLAFLLTLK